MVEPSHAIPPAETFEVELRVSRVDFEREHVLPLRTRDLQVGHLPLRRREREKRVVVDGHVPKVSLDATEYVCELRADEPAREVDEVNALIDELAAAGFLRDGTPLLLV